MTPDGDVVLSDFTLDDMEGGLVSVDLPAGTQSILRQDRQLFNNPLGVAVVANRPPVAALSAAPAVVAGGRPVSFDASASSTPRGSSSATTGTSTATAASRRTAARRPRSRARTGHDDVQRARAGDAIRTARSAVAGAPVRIDSIRPVISALRVRGSTMTYRLSEAARVTVRLQRLKGRRWRAVRTLRQDGVAGKEPAQRAAARACREARAARALPRRGLRRRRGRQPLGAGAPARLGSRRQAPAPPLSGRPRSARRAVGTPSPRPRWTSRRRPSSCPRARPSCRRPCRRRPSSCPSSTRSSRGRGCRRC